jgi:hypothetical protein
LFKDTRSKYLNDIEEGQPENNGTVDEPVAEGRRRSTRHKRPPSYLEGYQWSLTGEYEEDNADNAEESNIQ